MILSVTDDTNRGMPSNILTTTSHAGPTNKAQLNRPNRTTSTSTSTSISARTSSAIQNQSYDKNKYKYKYDGHTGKSYLRELVQQQLVAMNVSSSVSPSAGRRSRPKQKPPSGFITLGAFVHIAKTGGSTLSVTQLRNGCHSFAMASCENKEIANETFVSKLTTYYHIPDFHNQTDGLFSDQKGQKHKFYLLTVRDPFDRTISSFLFEHPANAKVDPLRRDTTPRRARRYAQYYRCAPTLEAFAFLLGGVYNRIGSTTNSTGSNDYCTDMIMIRYGGGRWENIPPVLRMDVTFIVRGLIGTDDKAKDTTNYKSWYNENDKGNGNEDINDSSWKNKTLLVVRKEHLNDDWISANRYLGQDDQTISVPKTKFRDSSTVRRPVGGASELSEEGRKNICLMLREEYDVYFGVLNKVGNIDKEDFAESLSVARKNCGSWLDFE